MAGTGIALGQASRGCGNSGKPGKASTTSLPPPRSCRVCESDSTGFVGVAGPILPPPRSCCVRESESAGFRRKGNCPPFLRRSFLPHAPVGASTTLRQVYGRAMLLPRFAFGSARVSPSQSFFWRRRGCRRRRVHPPEATRTVSLEVCAVRSDSRRERSFLHHAPVGARKRFDRFLLAPVVRRRYRRESLCCATRRPRWGIRAFARAGRFCSVHPAPPMRSTGG